GHNVRTDRVNQITLLNNRIDLKYGWSRRIHYDSERIPQTCTGISWRDRVSAHEPPGFSYRRQDIRHAWTGRDLGHGEVDARAAAVLHQESANRIRSLQRCLGRAGCDHHPARVSRAGSGAGGARYCVAERQFRPSKESELNG